MLAMDGLVCMSVRAICRIQGEVGGEGGERRGRERGKDRGVKGESGRGGGGREGGERKEERIRVKTQRSMSHLTTHSADFLALSCDCLH